MGHAPAPRQAGIGGIILIINPPEGQRPTDGAAFDQRAGGLKGGAAQVVVAKDRDLPRMRGGGRGHRTGIVKRQRHRLFQPDMLARPQGRLGHRPVQPVRRGDRHDIDRRVRHRRAPVVAGAGKAELPGKGARPVGGRVAQNLKPRMRAAKDCRDIAPGHRVALAHEAGADQRHAKRGAGHLHPSRPSPPPRSAPRSAPPRPVPALSTRPRRSWASACRPPPPCKTPQSHSHRRPYSGS